MLQDPVMNARSHQLVVVTCMFDVATSCILILISTSHIHQVLHRQLGQLLIDVAALIVLGLVLCHALQRSCSCRLSVQPSACPCNLEYGAASPLVAYLAAAPRLV